MLKLQHRQLQPAPAGTTKRYYDASSAGSSLIARSSTVSRDAVPSGIVASRVFVLQKTGPGTSNVLPEHAQPPSILIEHDRDSTRSGFGQRVVSRFGQPAVQNLKPAEETSGANSHTLIGLTASRKSHNEHHALVQQHLRMIRSSTQMQLLARPQDHGPNNKSLSKSKSLEPMRQPAYNSLDTEVMEEIEPSGKKRDIIAQTAIFPALDTAAPSEVSKTQAKSRKMRTLTSDTSFVTTSTVRRQSARDLYIEYGIDRPAGLISKHTFRDMGKTVRLESSPLKCHLCGWNNNSVYASCWRCGHSACSKCDDKPEKLSEPALKHNETPRQEHIEVSKLTKLPMRMRYIEEKPDNVNSLAKSRVALFSDVGVSSPTDSSTLSTITEPTLSRHPLWIEPPSHTLREQGSRTSILVGATKTSSKIKDSPFVLADAQVKKTSGKTVLSRRLLLAQNRRRAPHQLSKELQNDGSSSENEKVDEVAQQDDTGNEAQNLNLSRLGLPDQKHRIYQESDKGYAADICLGGSILGLGHADNLQSRPRSPEDDALSTNTTLVEESPASHSWRFQRLLEYTAKSESVPLPAPVKRSHSSHLWQHLSIVEDKAVPEFVECRGYPRTGHTRHDASAVDAGTVGECQHCLDDCSCEACQSTEHSVRCYTHPDHQAMVHIHHTPQQGTPNTLAQDLIDFTTSLSTVSYPHSALVSPRSSIAGPSIQQRTRDLLAKNKKTNALRMPTEHTSSNKKAVESVMKIGKGKASVATGVSPPLFSHLDMISRPSRKCKSDNDSSIESLDYFPADSTPFYTLGRLGRNNTAKSAAIDSIEYLTSTLSSTRTVYDPRVSDSQPKRNGLGLQALGKKTQNHHTVIESTTQENIEPALKPRTLLPALTAGRPISKALADKKAKMNLIQRNMTPVDGGSEIAPPRTLPYTRRDASSVRESIDDESRSCGSISHTGEHQCVWKRRYIESLAERSHTRQAAGKEGMVGEGNIKGITIVLHLEGKEDLVVEAEIWQGGRVSADVRV